MDIGIVSRMDPSFEIAGSLNFVASVRHVLQTDVEFHALRYQEVAHLKAIYDVQPYNCSNGNFQVCIARLPPR